MCMLIFVFLYVFILECTWFLFWEQVTSWSSWSHDAATDATPQALKIQLKNTHFHMLQMNFPFKSSGLVFYVRMVVLPYCYWEITSLLLEHDSLACGLHLQEASLVETTFLMLVCFTNAKCRCLPCTSKSKVSVWVCQVGGLRQQQGWWWHFIHTNWSRLCVLSAAALCATLHLITGFCAGREGSNAQAAFVFRRSRSW